jgi:hypothetical protein
MLAVVEEVGRGSAGARWGAPSHAPRPPGIAGAAAPAPQAPAAEPSPRPHLPTPQHYQKLLPAKGGGDDAAADKAKDIAAAIAAEVAELKDKSKHAFKYHDTAVQGTIFLQFPAEPGEAAPAAGCGRRQQQQRGCRPGRPARGSPPPGAHLWGAPVGRAGRARPGCKPRHATPTPLNLPLAAAPALLPPPQLSPAPRRWPSRSCARRRRASRCARALCRACCPSRTPASPTWTPSRSWASRWSRTSPAWRQVRPGLGRLQGRPLAPAPGRAGGGCAPGPGRAGVPSRRGRGATQRAACCWLVAAGTAALHHHR